MTQAFVDRYKVEGPLGTGGVSTVYRARDMVLRRTVALKVLENLPQGQEEEWVKVLREARLASSLSHPNICTVYDAGEDKGRHYIAMEYVEGSPLCDSVPEGGLDGPTVIRYGLQLAGGLAHAHERGVLHGDVKSANIIVTGERQVKLTDFGLGRRFRRAGIDKTLSSSQALLEAGPVGGSPGYTAPEVLRGEPNSVKSDIWSLGAVLYEMATGHVPPCGEDAAAACAAEPEALAKGLGGGLGPIIKRCLEEDPDGRYGSAWDVVYDLETLSAYPGEKHPRPHRERTRRILLLAAVALATLCAAVLLLPPTRGLIFNRATASAPSRAPAKTAGAANPEAKVWVNKKSRLYHCSSSVWYGKTPNGEYMRQDQAQGKGYRPAYGHPCE